jgi:sulfur carrier protein
MRLSINGEDRDFDGALSIRDLLGQLELASQQVAVEVNLELIPRDQHERYELGEGDSLEIVTLAGGG